jgi:hypothetical protein
MRKAATLIRINPDFPVPPADLEGQTISIMGNGLQSLQRIDQEFQKLDPRIAPGYKVNCCLRYCSCSGDYPKFSFFSGGVAE